MAIPALPLSHDLARRLDGRPLLVFVDVDGTLAAIASRPEDAVVPPATQHVLTELTALPDTHVIAISGRAAADARRLVGVNGAWIVGNHGIEIAAPGADAVARGDVVTFLGRMSDAAEQCETIAGRHVGVFVENKVWTLSVHYRLANQAIVPVLSAQVAAIARQYGLRLTYGRRVLELRPPIEVDKGTAALSLAKRFGSATGDASIVCLGDDRTDEDAFRALRAIHPRSVTVRVRADAHGSQPETTAEFELPDVHAVRELLEAILVRRAALAQ